MTETMITRQQFAKYKRIGQPAIRKGIASGFYPKPDAGKTPKDYRWKAQTLIDDGHLDQSEITIVSRIQA